MTNKSKTFLLRLSDYEKNILQMRAEELGVPMSIVLKQHLRDDKLKTMHLLTIQNVDTAEQKTKEVLLDRVEAQIVKEAIGTSVTAPDTSGDWMVISIIPKIDKRTEPTSDLMNRILSKINR